jgi:hypothetical protein
MDSGRKAALVWVLAIPVTLALLALIAEAWGIHVVRTVGPLGIRSKPYVAGMPFLILLLVGVVGVACLANAIRSGRTARPTDQRRSAPQDRRP